MLAWNQGGGEHSPQDSTSAQGWVRTRGWMALGVRHASPRIMEPLPMVWVPKMGWDP